MQSDDQPAMQAYIPTVRPYVQPRRSDFCIRNGPCFRIGLKQQGWTRAPSAPGGLGERRIYPRGWNKELIHHLESSLHRRHFHFLFYRLPSG